MEGLWVSNGDSGRGAKWKAVPNEANLQQDWLWDRNKATGKLLEAEIMSAQNELDDYLCSRLI